MSEPDSPAAGSYSHGPFQLLIGYDIVNDEKGLYVRLPIRRDHLNPHGVLHGGVLFTLLDAVGGRSLVDRTTPDSGERILSSATISLTVDFMRLVSAGVLYASATPDRVGKSVAFVSVKVTLDALDGEIVSRGIGTYRFYTRSLVKSM